MTTDKDTGVALRVAIIGGGASITHLHLQALAQLPGVRVVGMSDLNVEPGATRAREIDSPFFTDHRTMLAETRPDVAVICTPHPSHAALTLDCFAAGAHVLVEKPIAVEVAEADAMIEAANKAGRILAVNFQQRFRPVVEYARAFVERGELGALVRVLCIEPWYRTAAYYRAASWRGTWRGEGGGVLMNQAPHTLDLLCHVAGMPRKVWGWTRTFQHAIECEDTAQAMLEFDNGAPGYLHINTVEARARSLLQIVGDQASLELSGNQLTIKRFEPSLSVFRETSPEFFSTPNVHVETLDLPDTEIAGHLAVYHDLAQAIAEGRPPRADGREALMSLELADAIIFSSFAERSVTLPLDRAAYSELLGRLRS